MSPQVDLPGVQGAFLSDTESPGHFDHFTTLNKSTTADAATYHLQGTGTPTAVLADGYKGGAVILGMSSGTSDTSNLSLNGESFQTALDESIYITAKFRVADADKDLLFVGIHENGTLTTGNVTAETTVDGVGFLVDAADGVLDYVVGNGTSETQGSTGVTLSDATDIEVAAVIHRRDFVLFFVKSPTTGLWSEVAKVTTYIPTSVCTAIMQVGATDAGSDTMTVDYFGVKPVR